jgi:hypothetical protein
MEKLTMAGHSNSADSALRLDPIPSITRPPCPPNCGRVRLANRLDAVG